MKTPRLRDSLLVIFVLLAALLACGENPAATKACATPAKADGAECEKCCKANGANGYKYIGNDCSCLGK